MPKPLFIVTLPFDPSDGEKWQSYCQWAKIPGLSEVVSVDGMLCKSLFDVDFDWDHKVWEHPENDFFDDLDHVKKRFQDAPRKNIIGLYRNPECHISAPPGSGSFKFLGYDLIEDQTRISALTNCGGFPDVFRNEELNSFGLIEGFERACEIRRILAQLHPEEAHAQCELYAIWRLNETV